MEQYFDPLIYWLNCAYEDVDWKKRNSIMKVKDLIGFFLIKIKDTISKYSPTFISCFYTFENTRMTGLLRSILLFVLISFSGTLLSQEAINVFDRVYGPDQALCNGRKYDYFLPAGTRGDQYLLSPGYITGSLTIGKKCYKNISLNFDIFNQQVLLKYEDDRGGVNILEVSKGWVKAFSLGDKNFEFLTIGQQSRYFQVLGEGAVRILYYWRKSLSLDVTMGSSDYCFSPAVRDSYVYLDGQLKPYGSKRSLVRLFDKEHRAAIKSYLRKNRIHIKKASDQAIADMIMFIGNIR